MPGDTWNANLYVRINPDGTVDTAYPAGNKPVSGGACPTGWTCATKGDATEDIDEVSASAVTAPPTPEGEFTSFLIVGSDKGGSRGGGGRRGGGRGARGAARRGRGTGPSDG